MPRPRSMAGRITGRLVVENKLEVGASAVIRADIVARSIAVAKGAVIDGAVTVTSGEAVWSSRRSARRLGQVPPSWLTMRRSSQVGPGRRAKKPQCPP